MLAVILHEDSIVFALVKGGREILLIFDQLSLVGNRSSIIVPAKSKDSIPKAPSTSNYPWLLSPSTNLVILPLHPTKN